MRSQWISRLLANPLIDTGEVMAPFAREVLARARAQAHTLVLIIDQSQVNATHQMVMVSLRVGGRAVPLAWQVKNTQGAIGFAEQRAALDRVAALLPAGVRPVVMESMQNRGVIRLLLAVPGHHSRAGSPDSVDGRRPRVCRSARRCARPGRAAPSLCSSASAVPCSCAWPRSH